MSLSEDENEMDKILSGYAEFAADDVATAAC